MSEELKISGSKSKQERYVTLLPQIRDLIDLEPDAVACMANVVAMIAETFQFWWTGFYRVMDDALVLGPFQGPLACTRIARGRGVCGTAWEKGTTLIVPDVDSFPGHIACSSASRSEIVVPIFKDGRVVAVIDIDSEHPSNFDDIDAYYLERIATLIATRL